MPVEQRLSFGPYRLDLARTRLWWGKQEVKITGKAFAVLRYLATHAGKLVTKDALFRAVWPGTVVSDAALVSCIKDLRRALRDTARERRYIETVHRRGYRFIGKVVRSQYPIVMGEYDWQRVESTKYGNKLSSSPPARSLQSPAPVFVGREAELTQLHRWLDKALTGERQIIFVSGEPGIGKTTLVDSFVSRVRRHGKFEVQKAPSRTPNTGLPSTSVPRVGRGQCIEHYGAGEAYLPVLEALGRLCREPNGQRLIELLSRHAPSWLVQIPALLSQKELEELQRRTAGVTRERMLRELAEALEVVTAERPLVLVLEDLHWSDMSTLDFLSMLARRYEPAPLMVVGTYRPVEVLTREHPLKRVKQELQAHGSCAELLLDFLSEEDVAEYLAVRFCTQPSLPVSLSQMEKKPNTAPLLQKLAQAIHRRTDGNPLFMVNVANNLVAQGVLVQSEGRWELKEKIIEVVGAVPESLQQLIVQQIERLRPETQRLLEVASVAGAEFSAAAVAAGLETEIDVVEEQCEAVARQEHFLQAGGTAEWPDGTVATRYGFRHALYQEVLYHRLTARRRQRLHQQIGEREEQGYGSQAREIAAELAVHFERGREYHKAVRYLQQAGQNAMQRSANQEAITLFTKGLELLNLLPDTPERTRQELRLQVALGPSLQAVKGFAAPEVERVCARIRELYQRVEELPLRLLALTELNTFYLSRAEYRMAYESGEQLLHLAQTRQDHVIQMGAHMTSGAASLWLGELLSACTRLEQGLALYDLHQPRSVLTPILPDRKVAFLPYLAFLLEVLGYPDRARQRIHEVLTLARGLTHPFSLAYALTWTAYLSQVRREGQLVQEWAEALIALSAEQGFAQFFATGLLMRGWALSDQGQTEEGIAQIRQGLAARRATGATMMQSHFLALLAEAYERAGQPEKGLAALIEALTWVDKTEERYYEAELYRLKGELLLMRECRHERQKSKRKSQQFLNPNPQIPNPQLEAEECFLKAIAVARQQGAKSWELRAAMSLVRLRQQQALKHGTRRQGSEARSTEQETCARLAEAHSLLSEVCHWFTEGFDTKDMQEAKALLDSLASGA